MTPRIRLVLLFALSAAAAIGFFGFITYDTAIRLDDRREASMVRDALSPLVRDVARAAAGHGDVDGYLQNIHRIFGPGLAVAVATPDGLVHRTPGYDRIALAEGGGQAPRVITWDVPLDRTGTVAHVAFRADTAGRTSYLAAMARSLSITAVFIVWLSMWAAVFISNLMQRLHEQKESLRHMALHDSLTDLPNRKLLYERLDTMTGGEAAAPQPFALCFMDLDGFKEINDTQGHPCGDHVLVELGRRLKEAVRKGDTVARLGGDEFAIILADIDKAGTVTAVEKLRRLIGEAIVMHNRPYSVSCSIGIAIFPDHGGDPATLVQHADIAMYHAKCRRLGSQVFHPGLLPDSCPLPAARPDTAGRVLPA